MVKVAIYGIHGLLGSRTIKSVLSEPFASKITFPVKVVTSDTSKKPIEDDRLEYVSYKDVPFKEAFAGVDVVVNLSNPAFAPVQDVLEAVIANKVKLYIPSQFGTDLEALEDNFPGFLRSKLDHSAAARNAGIKTVDIYTGLFIDEDQKFMGKELSILDLNAETNTVELIGDKNTKFNPSFLQDIGKSIAALVIFEDFSKIPNTIRIFSDKVTAGDLLAHYEKVHSVKLNVKKIPTTDVIAAAKKCFVNFTFADFRLYLQSFVAMGEGKGIVFENNNSREFVNPNESLFKWTKYVI